MSVLLCSSCCDPVIALWLYKERSRAKAALQAASQHCGSTSTGITFGVMSEMLLPRGSQQWVLCAPARVALVGIWKIHKTQEICPSLRPKPGITSRLVPGSLFLRAGVGAAEGDFGHHLQVVCLTAGNSRLFPVPFMAVNLSGCSCFDTNGWWLCPAQPSPCQLQGWLLALQSSWALLPVLELLGEGTSHATVVLSGSIWSQTFVISLLL